MTRFDSILKAVKQRRAARTTPRQRAAALRRHRADVIERVLGKNPKYGPAHVSMCHDFEENPLSYQSGPDRDGFTAGGSAEFMELRARHGQKLYPSSNFDRTEMRVVANPFTPFVEKLYSWHGGGGSGVYSVASTLHATGKLPPRHEVERAIRELKNLKRDANYPETVSAADERETKKLALRLEQMLRHKSSNPELLVVGLNPEGGRNVSHCIKVKSHRRCYKKGRGRKVKGRRVRSRGRKSHARRGRGKPRSWRAFVRKHRGVMKRLGLKRGIRKVAKMWKRLR